MVKHFNLTSQPIIHLLIVCSGVTAILSTFWGCEQNVTVDLEEYKPKVVVHSLLSPDSIPTVILTQSEDYFAQSTSDRGYQTLQNALVVISYNGQHDTLEQKTRQQQVNPYQEGTNDFGSDQDGTKDTIPFHYYEGQFQVQPGRTYQLQVFYNGTKVTGQTTVPRQVPLDSADYAKGVFEQFNFTDTARIIKGFVQDPPGEENAYRLHATFYASVPQGLLRLEELTSSSITFDKGADGEVIPVELELPAIETDEYADNFPDTVVSVIQVQHLTTASAKYIRSLNEQQSSGNSPFSEPVLIKSTVENGLGVFGSYMPTDTQTLRIPLNY